MSTHTMPRSKVRPTPCGRCGEDTVEINLLVDGHPLTMRSCTPCDVRTWHRDDAPVAFDSILADVTSTPTRYRRHLEHR